MPPAGPPPPGTPPVGAGEGDIPVDIIGVVASGDAFAIGDCEAIGDIVVTMSTGFVINFL